jgi:N-acetylneuraminic acid mutarotase
MRAKLLLARTGALVLALGLCFIGAAKAAADSPPATGPSALVYALLTYDEDTKRVIMLGGARSGGDWEEPEEVWAFDPDAERWELIGNLESDCFESMVYDAGAGKIILYCGVRYNPDGHHPWFPIDIISETWAYDVAKNTWENLNPGPIRPPEGLIGTRMAYDSESGVVILHGGLDVNSFRFSNDTWAYDSASNTWTNMRPAGAPAGRNYHGLTYDAAADRVLSIAGGVSPNAATWLVTNDVFAYDYNENVWTQLDSGNAPAREYVSAQYVPSADRVILFGGATYAASDPGLLYPIPNDDTWEFDSFSNTWTLLEPRKSPSPRIWHGMAATERGLVLFGGGETRDTPTDETWLFDAENQEWKEVKRRQ